MNVLMYHPNNLRQLLSYHNNQLQQYKDNVTLLMTRHDFLHTNLQNGQLPQHDFRHSCKYPWLIFVV